MGSVSAIEGVGRREPAATPDATTSPVSPAARPGREVPASDRPGTTGDRTELYGDPPATAPHGAESLANGLGEAFQAVKGSPSPGSVAPGAPTAAAPADRRNQYEFVPFRPSQKLASTLSGLPAASRDSVMRDGRVDLNKVTPAWMDGLKPHQRKQFMDALPDRAPSIGFPSHGPHGSDGTGSENLAARRLAWNLHQQDPGGRALAQVYAARPDAVFTNRERARPDMDSASPRRAEYAAALARNLDTIAADQKAIRDHRTAGLAGPDAVRAGGDVAEAQARAVGDLANIRLRTSGDSRAAFKEMMDRAGSAGDGFTRSLTSNSVVAGLIKSGRPNQDMAALLTHAGVLPGVGTGASWAGLFLHHLQANQGAEARQLAGEAYRAYAEQNYQKPDAGEQWLAATYALKGNRVLN